MIKNIIKIVILCTFTATLYTIPPQLKNCGASCYMNATIQCLYNIQPLTDYLLTSVNKNWYPQNNLIPLYIDLIRAITISPQKIVQPLQAFAAQTRQRMSQVTQRKGAQQEDASEFLGLMINDLSDTTQHNDFFELLFNTRYMQSQVYEQPVAYKTESVEREPLPYLPLIAKNNKDLTQCLRQFFIDTIEGGKIYNEIIYAPDVLILSLKRFEFAKTASKIANAITIPRTINLYDFVYEKENHNRDDYTYELIGAIIHGGGISGGHYTAYIQEWNTGEWYLCDDSTIKKTTINDALNKIKTGYIYFYRKGNTACIDVPVHEPLPVEKSLLLFQHSLEQLLQQLLSHS